MVAHEMIQTARFRKYVSSRLPLMLLGLALSFGCRTEFGMAQWWTSVGDAIYKTNAGNVGIGTTAPGNLLQVAGGRLGVTQTVDLAYDGTNDATFRTIHVSNGSATAGAASGIQITVGSASEGDGYIAVTKTSATFGDLVFGTRASVLAEKMRITATGNVGIGTTAPTAKLELYDSSSRVDLRFNRATSTNAAELGSFAYQGLDSGSAAQTYAQVLGLISSNSAGIERGRVDIETADSGVTAARLTVDGSKVGIGTTAPVEMLHVAGNLKVDGNIAAKYQDVAEWVDASVPAAAGTVMVLDLERSNHVLPARRAYDTTVAGIVSATPGLLLGEPGPGRVKVATTGRVHVMVDASRTPIRIGDLLVTSEIEGVAMRSDPLDLGGVPIHRPGTLIGKALEPLPAGRGKVLVLLSLQ